MIRGRSSSPIAIATAAAALVLAVICLVTSTSQTTQSAFVAKITATQDTAGTATYFTCAAAFTADASSARFSYRLNEASGSKSAADSSSNGATGTYRGTMMTNTAAPGCPRDPGGAYVLDGSSSYLTGPTKYAASNVLTEEVWFKTTVPGGRLIGFSSSTSGASTNYDRHIFMNNSGQLVFGVYVLSAEKTIVSSQSYSDGTWHHVAATLSSAGMILYVDGSKAAEDTTTTTSQNFSGYVRVGYDTLANVPAANRPTNYYFTGSMCFAAVYTTALTATQIANHFAAGDS